MTDSVRFKINDVVAELTLSAPVSTKCHWGTRNYSRQKRAGVHSRYLSLAGRSR